MKRSWFLPITLLAACGGPLPSPPSTPANDLLLLPPGTLQHIYAARTSCLDIAGADVSSTIYSPITNGMPTPPPPYAYNCVEAVSTTNTTTGVMTVDVDNPQIFTNIQLPTTRTHDGAAHACTISQGSVASPGYQSALYDTDNYCNLTATVTGGSATPPGFLSAGSVAGTLYPMLTGGASTAGGSTSDATVRLDGLRVGYAGLNVQLQLENGVQQTSAAAWPVEVTLNPSVLLVPIEAVEVDGTTIFSTQANEPAAQAIFDRVPTITNEFSADDPEGDLTVATRTLNDVVGTGTDGRGRFDQYVVPDDIWSACGIQFRLVNHFVMKTDDAHAQPPALPPQGATDDTPFEENRDQAQKDPRHIPGMPQVLFPQRCTYGTAPENGLTDTVSEVACVNLAYVTQDVDFVLAHELGHILGLDDGYDPKTRECLVTGDPQNLMCLEGGYDLTSTQCQIARGEAQSLISELKLEGRYF